MGIKMVGNGVVPFPCGSERGKMSCQTREVDEKKEKEEKKEDTRVWKKKNVLPDPKYCDFRVWKRKNALPDPRRAKMQEMTVEEKARI